MQSAATQCLLISSHPLVGFVCAYASCACSLSFSLLFSFSPFPGHPTRWKNVTLQPVYTQVILRNRPRTIGVPSRSSEELVERMESGNEKEGEESDSTSNFGVRKVVTGSS